MVKFVITNEFIEICKLSNIQQYLIDNNITKIQLNHNLNYEQLEFILLNIPKCIKTVYIDIFNENINLFDILFRFIKITKIRKFIFMHINRIIINKEIDQLLDLIANNNYIKNVDFRGITGYYYIDKLFNIKSLESIHIDSSYEYYDQSIIHGIANNKNFIKLTICGSYYNSHLLNTTIMALNFNKKIKYFKIKTEITIYELMGISRMLDDNKSLLKIKYHWRTEGQELHNNIQKKLERNKQLLADIIDNHINVIFYIPEIMEFYKEMLILYD